MMSHDHKIKISLGGWNHWNFWNNWNQVNFRKGFSYRYTLVPQFG
jgi:hypothetical protein